MRQRREERPAITEARRLLGARKGPPTEADAPRRSSQLPRVLPGQIDIFGTTHDPVELDDGADEDGKP
jgi:hypothetical protein